MKKQTRSRILREKTATLSSLIDACDTIRSVVNGPNEDSDATNEVLTQLWSRLEKRICEHLPSTIEEADIQKLFLNNTMKALKIPGKELTYDEGVVYLSSFNRMVSFYRQFYQQIHQKTCSAKDVSG